MSTNTMTNTNSALSAILSLLRSIQRSIGFKLIVVAVLTMLLLAPMSMIDSIQNERRVRQEQVFEEVADKWAGAQTVIGPVVNIPYLIHNSSADNETSTIMSFIHILPDHLTMHAELEPEKRHRGIFDVVVYRASITMEGDFPDIHVTTAETEHAEILYDKAFVSLGISDMRGIENAASLSWNGREVAFEPGLGSTDLSESGIQAFIGSTSANEQPNSHFRCALKLRGSREYNVVPIGKTTDVDVSAPWGDPSFSGAFLPTNSELSDHHFLAHWAVLNVNRNYPQSWTGDKYEIEGSAFGVKLYNAVDNYSKTDRAQKYAILIIGLTFLVFLFLESRSATPVHIVQYSLIGLALCIFYVLLLSISEQLSFNSAYAIASVLTIGLIGWFSHSVFGQRSLVLAIVLSLVLLYSFVFAILQLQDYALLVGSIALFLVLAVVMQFSKSIDWQGKTDRTVTD